MKLADHFQKRQQDWHELERLLDGNGRSFWRKPTADAVLRLGELYRAVCADLMLAEAQAMPRETVQYLHHLVGRGHNAIYRAQRFSLEAWITSIFWTVPRQLRGDPFLLISALVLFGGMILFGLLGAIRTDFADQFVGREQLLQYEAMYSQPVTSQNRSDSLRTAFYIQHNTSIGLRCYALGVFPLVGPLFVLFTQALQLGVVFGHMSIVPSAGNFYTFVTAHAPFELTAIVFCGAAGMRLGWGFLAPGDRSRREGLRASAKASLPIAGVGALLFLFAAFVEGYISPADYPYAIKVQVAVGSAVLIAAYLLFCGRDASFWAKLRPWDWLDAIMGPRSRP